MVEDTTKPLIESIINTIALALTAYGVQRVTSGDPLGYISVLFGVAIEWFKYWGRKVKLW